jgi:hypothetical protein
MANMRKKLLIKHIVGRVLLDTSVQGNDFNLQAGEQGWNIQVGGVESSVADGIKERLTELNLFYMEEDEDGGSLRKWWLYGKESPSFGYNSDSRTLTLHVDTRQAYSNESVNA